MVATVVTEPQTFSAEEQLKNAQIVREFIGGMFERSPDDRYDRYVHPDCRILFESREDYPVPQILWSGLELMKENDKEIAKLGFTWEMEIHSVYTCGPLVIVARTDTRKAEGQPDKPVPGVGVFAVRNSKITAWSDYYR
jgi:limonene-1,2-epoxide hydrolase